MIEDEDQRVRYERLRQIVLKAQGLAELERGPYVETACGADADLRRDVLDLLSSGSSVDDLDAEAEKLHAATATSVWEALIAQLASRGPGFERYVFEGELARGGMGVIHRVFDQDARRTLALKLMLGQADTVRTGETPAVDDASLGRFVEEAQVTSQLDHPGIVPVHEIGVDGDGRVYFTMKLVKGEDLRSVFDRVADLNDGEWSTTRALGVMLRVCEAMAYAHEKGVVHRDLKPGNVMVGKFGEAYVMDWGLARVLGKDDPRDLRLEIDESAPLLSERVDAAAATPESPIVTMDGAVIGTPAYMPPEQAQGRVDRVGPPADVYAVGAMLYHLLAQRVPYTERGERVSPRTILAMVMRGAPEPLTRLAPDAPAELVAIVEKAMSREISDRYTDMTALARDLRAFLEDRVVEAYETGGWAEAKKWVRRNRTLALTVGLAMIAVVSMAGWAIIERNVAQDERGVAVAERDRVLRLSDQRRLNILRSEAENLWPAHPSRIEAMRDWLGRAEELLENLPLHEAALEKTRAYGIPMESDVPKDSAPDVAYDFGDDIDARWWHDAMSELVAGLDALTNDDVHEVTVAAIEARLSWAETVEDKTTSGAEVAGKWAEARKVIRAHPSYSGLNLKPQLGLVPLGADPESGLWEFAHPRTGDIPRRDPDTGRLDITEDTGLIFVLIPAGRYRLGAQGSDPEAPHYDPLAEFDEDPVHEVSLSSYFLSKYEMTQRQWMEITGDNPSWWAAKYPEDTSVRCPVETVSWFACSKALFTLGMAFPTEAQWEAACRAGTDTPWHVGRDVNELGAFANVADATFSRVFKVENAEAFDDGFDQPAPVGSFLGNDFGLFDVHGNVWEWCRDGYAEYGTVFAEGDALSEPQGATFRLFRGGSYNYRASIGRSGDRCWNSPEIRNLDLGLRPARNLDL